MARADGGERKPLSHCIMKSLPSTSWDGDRTLFTKSHTHTTENITMYAVGNNDCFVL